MARKERKTCERCRTVYEAYAGRFCPDCRYLGHRKYGEEHRRRLFDQYRRSGSIQKAARAAGVGESWAYQQLAREGEIRRPWPSYKAPLVLEAINLYRGGLSVRAVADELARRHDDSPSREWVREQLERAGEMRSRSRAMQLREARERDRDYDQLREQAAALFFERAWSERRIARELGVSRGFVRRATDGESRLGPSDASIRRAWQADLPEAAARRKRLEKVGHLRALGYTCQALSRKLGVSISTIYLDLRRLSVGGVIVAVPRRRAR